SLVRAFPQLPRATQEARHGCPVSDDAGAKDQSPVSEPQDEIDLAEDAIDDDDDDAATIMAHVPDELMASLRGNPGDPEIGEVTAQMKDDVRHEMPTVPEEDGLVEALVDETKAPPAAQPSAHDAVTPAT